MCWIRKNAECLGCIVAVVFGCSVFADEQKDRPNIVIIMADDMGWSDLGCYGGEIETPHIDSLATDGMRFTQFYNNAICGPTRASLLTGLSPPTRYICPSSSTLRSRA